MFIVAIIEKIYTCCIKRYSKDEEDDTDGDDIYDDDFELDDYELREMT